MKENISVFRNQGMSTVDFIGVAIVFPLLYLQLALGVMYWYMKENHIEEISDFVAYPILVAGLVPAVLTIWNFIAGIVVDTEKRVVSAPFFMIFRRRIHLDDVESRRTEDRKYVRVSQFRMQVNKWYRYLVVFRMKTGAERYVVFRGKGVRNAFLKTLSLMD